MRAHYGLDRLVEHGVRPLPETTLLVNPAWRTLDTQIRRLNTKLHRQHAAFSAHILRPEENDPRRHRPARGQKGETLAAIQQKQTRLSEFKALRKTHPGTSRSKTSRPKTAWPILVQTFQRLTLRSVKFIRWIRVHLFARPHQEPDIASLRHLYATL